MLKAFPINTFKKSPSTFSAWQSHHCLVFDHTTLLPPGQAICTIRRFKLLQSLLLSLYHCPDLALYESISLSISSSSSSSSSSILPNFCAYQDLLTPLPTSVIPGCCQLYSQDLCSTCDDLIDLFLGAATLPYSTNSGQSNTIGACAGGNGNSTLLGNL